jgi:hypothetical protein
LMAFAFIANAMPLQASESQGGFSGIVESIKGFFNRINPFSKDPKAVEGEKRLEHYDPSKNEKLEAQVNGPSAAQDAKKTEKKEDYGRVIESEEFIGEAYPEITEAAKEAAPSNPKDAEKNNEEVSKIKEELAKEESKEDLKNNIYLDIENETVPADQKLEDEVQMEQKAEKEVAEKMEKTGKEVIAAKPESAGKTEVKK